MLGAALDELPKLPKEGRKLGLVFMNADWGEGEQWEYVDNVVRVMLESEALRALAARRRWRRRLGRMRGAGDVGEYCKQPQHEHGWNVL